MKLYTNRLLYFKLLLLVVCLCLPGISSAESMPEAIADSSMPEGVPDPRDLLDILVISVCILVILVLLYLLYVANVLLNELRPKAAKEKVKPLFQQILSKLSYAVPIEEEHAT